MRTPYRASALMMTLLMLTGACSVSPSAAAPPSPSVTPIQPAVSPTLPETAGTPPPAATLLPPATVEPPAPSPEPTAAPALLFSLEKSPQEFGGTGTFQIGLGDLDADGDADLWGKRWGEGYVVQLNDGTGRLTPAWQMEDPQSMNGGIALDDFDGDGDLDALVANGFRTGGSYPTKLLWNDGTGRFTDSGQRLNETKAAEFAVGDLDGDGDLDVFVSNMDLPNEVWLNDGRGKFVDSGLRLGSSQDTSSKATLGDLDGDGDLDVFVGSLMGRPEIWFNPTAGTAARPLQGP